MVKAPPPTGGFGPRTWAGFLLDFACGGMYALIPKLELFGRGAATSNTDINLYLSEISCFQLLAPEEERELARRIRQGDQEARNQMVRANLRLVVSIAKN